jgi:hypothetical protein
MKWAFLGFGVAVLGFFLELLLHWRIGGDLALVGILAVIVLTIAGVVNFFKLIIGR